MSEKISLSKCTECELKGGVVVKVYPASLETLKLLAPKLKALETVDGNDFGAQIDASIDVIFALVKEDNADITKELLQKVLTLQACGKIIELGVGNSGALGL